MMGAVMVGLGGRVGSLGELGLQCSAVVGRSWDDWEWGVLQAACLGVCGVSGCWGVCSVSVLCPC